MLNFLKQGVSLPLTVTACFVRGGARLKAGAQEPGGGEAPLRPRGAGGWGEFPEGAVRGHVLPQPYLLYSAGWVWGWGWFLKKTRMESLHRGVVWLARCGRGCDPVSCEG